MRRGPKGSGNKGEHCRKCLKKTTTATKEQRRNEGMSVRRDREDVTYIHTKNTQKQKRQKKRGRDTLKNLETEGNCAREGTGIKEGREVRQGGGEGKGKKWS